MKNINFTHAAKMQQSTHQETINSFKEHLTGTITLKPSVFTHDKSGMGRNAKSQFNITGQKIKETLEGFSESFLMAAELTKNGNIHYHLMIKFKYDFGLELLIDHIKTSKIIGFVKIEPPNNKAHEEAFKNYILKDYIKTYSIINKNVNHENDLKDIVFVPSIKKIKASNKFMSLFSSKSSKEGEDEGYSSSSLDNLIFTYDNN